MAATGRELFFPVAARTPDGRTCVAVWPPRTPPGLIAFVSSQSSNLRIMLRFVKTANFAVSSWRTCSSLGRCSSTSFVAGIATLVRTRRITVGLLVLGIVLLSAGTAVVITTPRWASLS
jgi:hypothetical protein